MDLRRFPRLRDWFLPLLIQALLMALPPAASSKPLVLVIESYNDQYPWQASYKAALTGVLKPACDLRFFQMDTKRLQPEQHAAQAESAWQDYLKLKPALVMLGDDAALNFLGPRLVATTTPCVYLGINANPRTYIPAAQNFTGVLERPLFKRNIIFLKSIMKMNLKKVLILFDTDLTSHVLKEDTFEGEDSLDLTGVRVDLKLIGDLDTWRSTVLAARNDGYEAIILGLYHTLFDREGRHVDSEELLHWTSDNSPVPMFCFWDFTVGAKAAIGGLVLYGEVQGRVAGELALRILSGEKPNQLPPVVPEQGRFLFSRAQMARWGIVLPPDIAAQASFTE